MTFPSAEKVTSKSVKLRQRSGDQFVSFEEGLVKQEKIVFFENGLLAQNTKLELHFEDENITFTDISFYIYILP